MRNFFFVAVLLVSFGSFAIVHVRPGYVVEDADGSSWELALPELQSAIDVSYKHYGSTERINLPASIDPIAHTVRTKKKYFVGDFVQFTISEGGEFPNNPTHHPAFEEGVTYEVLSCVAGSGYLVTLKYQDGSPVLFLAGFCGTGYMIMIPYGQPESIVRDRVMLPEAIDSVGSTVRTNKEYPAGDILKFSISLGGFLPRWSNIPAIEEETAYIVLSSVPDGDGYLMTLRKWGTVGIYVNFSAGQEGSGIMSVIPYRQGEVWASAGVYTVSRTHDDAMYRLPNNMTVSGSWADLGLGAWNHNVDLTPSIINASGLDDGHVFFMSDSCSVVNFLIRESDSRLKKSPDGAAIFSKSGIIFISGCTFTSNKAKYGGAVYVSDGELTVSDSTFYNNTAEDGGAVYAVDSKLTVSDSVFINNKSLSYTGSGGALSVLRGSSVSLLSSSFSECVEGSGVYLRASDLSASKCTFSYNPYGAGMLAIDSDLVVDSCAFKFNSGQYFGGPGGGINSTRSDISVTNSIFSGNPKAAGVFSVGDNNISVYSSSFTDNEYGIWASGNAPGGSVTLYNSILYGNSTEYSYDGTAPNVAYYCDVHGGISGNGNIDDDPLFVFPGDLKIPLVSPCYNSGTSDHAPLLDYAGTSRPQYTLYDMGAYESYIYSVVSPLYYNLNPYNWNMSLSKDGRFWFLSGYFGTPGAIWKTDGSTLWKLTRNIYYIDFFLGRCGDRFLFHGRVIGDIRGNELYVTDGTEDGTTLVKDIRPGTGSSQIFNVRQFDDNRVCFIANDYGSDPVALYVWISDGTAEGTFPLKTYGLVSVMGDAATKMTVHSGFAGNPSPKIYFSGVSDDIFYPETYRYHGVHTWVSDGTVPGTKPFFTSRSVLGSSSPEEFTSSGGTLFLTSMTDVSGMGVVRGLYAAKPTDLNFVLIYANSGFDAKLGESTFISFENESSGAYYDGANVYFAGYLPGSGWEPWISDFTGPGTRMLTDIIVGSEGSTPSKFYPVESSVVFFARTGTADHYRLLYKADPVLGAVSLWDLPSIPVGELSSIAVCFSAVGVLGDSIYFTASSVDHIDGYVYSSVVEPDYIPVKVLEWPMTNAMGYVNMGQQLIVHTAGNFPECGNMFSIYGK